MAIVRMTYPEYRGVALFELGLADDGSVEICPGFCLAINIGHNTSPNMISTPSINRPLKVISLIYNRQARKSGKQQGGALGTRRYCRSCDRFGCPSECPDTHAYNSLVLCANPLITTTLLRIVTLD